MASKRTYSRDILKDILEITDTNRCDVLEINCKQGIKTRIQKSKAELLGPESESAMDSTCFIYFYFFKPLGTLKKRKIKKNAYEK